MGEPNRHDLRQILSSRIRKRRGGVKADMRQLHADGNPRELEEHEIRTFEVICGILMLIGLVLALSG